MNNHADMNARFPFTEMSGRLCAGIWTPGEDLVLPDCWGSNLLQYSAADVLARLCAGDQTAFPAGMYFEFTNNFGAWAEPEVARSGAQAYFEGLDGVTQDFLRVPFIGTPGTSESSDLYDGNVVDFVAMSSGTAGEIGAAFSKAANSTVVGGAVVAVPDWNDRSQDIIITRGYLTTAREAPDAPANVVMRWQITFG